MTGRNLPTVFINEVLGAHADDPSFARIDVRMPGNIEAVIALHVSQIDELIRALIAAKGYFDWPPPSQDQHHKVSDVEIAAGEGLVAFRVVSLTPDQSPNGVPPPPGHMTYLVSADDAQVIAKDLLAGAKAAGAFG